MFEVRPTGSREEFSRALWAIEQYVGGPATDEMLARFERVLPLDRMHAAYEDGETVGGAGAFPFEMSVPGGGRLRCAGITVVGVYSTHRRRGVLRAMMDVQLRDIHERGEPMAALWASEETIYGRFGYGLAAWTGELTVKKPYNAFAQPWERRGRVRFVTPDEAATLFPSVWTELMRQRPGVFQRSEEWWTLRRLRIPDDEKANPKRLVALELDGSVQGYAIFKPQPKWEDGVGMSNLEVFEAIATSPQANAELWRYLLDIDWQATLHVSLMPPDHPLFLLLATPRRVGYRMGDGLWARVVDVGAALSGRAYAVDGSVVLEVRDAMCPWNDGRWRVSSDGTKRTDDAAELALDVSALGSAYLGGVTFKQLWEAGRVEELTDRAVGRADTLFAWRPLPWCPEIF